MPVSSTSPSVPNNRKYVFNMHLETNRVNEKYYARAHVPRLEVILKETPRDLRSVS